MLKCNVVMTRDPECCLSSDPVSTAAIIMREENVGSVPVIDDKQSKHLVGIITDRDLALQVVAHRCDSKTTRVADVMTRVVITCHEDDDLQLAMDSMAQHQLRRIPIVDSDNRILGIIAQADIATRLNQPVETAKVVEEISRPPI